MVLVGATTLVLLGLGVDRPITFPDELIYNELGRSFATGLTFRVAGTPLSAWTYGPIYPVMLAPIYSLSHTAHSAYVAVRAFNAVAFASACIPVYRFARRFTSSRASVLVAVLTVLIPASVYSTKIETENIAFPFAMWVLWFLLEMTERPTVRRQLVVMALLLLAPLVRFEFIALHPAAAATALFSGPGTSRERVRLFGPLLAGIGAAACVAVAAVAVHGSLQARGIGGDASVSIKRVLEQLGANLAALDLYVGIVPFAVLVSALLVLRRGGGDQLDRNLRPLVVLGGSFAASLVAVSAVYLASIGRTWRPVVPADRYVFYAVPLLWILFLCWIEQRPLRGTVQIVAPFAALLPLVVGPAEVHGKGLVATSSSLAYMPWMFLRALSPKGWWVALLACYCAISAVGAVFLGRRFVRGWAVGSSLITTAFAFTYVSFGAWYARHHTPPAGWLDARANGRVVGLWIRPPTHAQALAMRSVATTNQNLHAVYFVKRADTLGPSIKGRMVRGRAFSVDGLVLHPQFVLTSSRTRVVGVAIGSSAGLTLYRVNGALRVVAPVH